MEYGKTDKVQMNFRCVLNVENLHIVTMNAHFVEKNWNIRRAMNNIKQLRARLWELARLTNQAKGEEKQRLIEEKEKVMKEYYKLKREEENER